MSRTKLIAAILEAEVEERAALEAYQEAQAKTAKEREAAQAADIPEGYYALRSWVLGGFRNYCVLVNSPSNIVITELKDL